ncbi:alpha/beta hydrolase [Paenibacillus cisolokensis]|uniref:alpha/beta fold hydrolase n=1 Tax=Paenibacillus cisolokensis TaxID=1658519 RepID=UPI003D2ACFBD
MRRDIRLWTWRGEPFEYSVVGEGKPVLMMHGGHSNCREEFGYRELIAAGYRLITPSRPGYGRSSKAIGRTLDEACEAYAGLLDHLGADAVHVIAFSAGGPSGIRFAGLYPERVRSLVLLSAVTGQWLTPDHREYKMARILFGPWLERYTWLALRLASNIWPRFGFRLIARNISLLPLKEIERRMGPLDIEAVRRMNNRQRSGSGFALDLKQAGQLRKADLEAVRAPALIVHSPWDMSVGIRNARYACEHIPHAEFAEADAWGHLIWLGRGGGAVDRACVDFLRRHDGTAPFRPAETGNAGGFPEAPAGRSGTPAPKRPPVPETRG